MEKPDSDNMLSTSRGLLLPPEVLRLIFQYLPGSDLKQARLLSRSLNEVCSEPLFRSIVLVRFTSCLVKFLELLNSSCVGKYIRKLIYDDRWHHEL